MTVKHDSDQRSPGSTRQTWKAPTPLSELGIVGLDGLPKFGPIHLASFDFLSR